MSKPKEPTLSLHMIVKEETDILERCLKSIVPFVDELIIGDTGNNPETLKILKKYKAKVYPVKWRDDFAWARNQVLKRCTSDWIVWCDADDVWRHGERIKTILAKTDKQTDVIRIPYAYEIDKKAYEDYKENPYLYTKTFQLRERFIRNNGAFQWKGRIHETLCVVRNVGAAETRDVWIDHFPDKKESSERNLKIMLKEYEDTKPKVDPRILFYLGVTYFGMEKWEESEKYFKEYIPVSGWDEQIYIAKIRLGDIYRHRSEWDKAYLIDLEAMNLIPTLPDAYIGLATTNFFNKNWRKAIFWASLSMKQKITSPTYDHNPQVYTMQPLRIIAQSYMKLNDIDRALQAAQQLYRLQPKDKRIKEMVELLSNIKEDVNLANSYIDIAYALSEEKRKKLFALVPDKIADHPFIVSMQKEIVTKEKSKTGRDLAIFCGASGEDWSPLSLQKGIGGSEEATIHLAQQLQNKGWNVIVYNSCGDQEGEHGGVHYVPFYYFNPKDHWDVLISWRLPQVFQWDINADKRYLWMHDVPSLGEFTEDRVKNMDGIFVLSEYHKNLFKNSIVPEEKLIISRNGINIDDVKNYNPKRNPHKIIYTSAPDRGLEQMLDKWAEIRKAVPDAEFHIFYGWQTFDNANSGDPSLMKWKDRMIKKLDQPGVHWRGRVDHHTLHKEFKESGVYGYYCTFPEISCISAMKAQALGAVPVTTDFAAVNETVQHGIKVHVPDPPEWTKYEGFTGDMPVKEAVLKLGQQETNWKSINDWTKELIALLQDEKRQEEIRKSMKVDLGWKGVADQWHDLFVKN